MRNRLLIAAGLIVVLAVGGYVAARALFLSDPPEEVSLSTSEPAAAERQRQARQRDPHARARDAKVP
jgi:hypothetical protein